MESSAIERDPAADVASGRADAAAADRPWAIATTAAGAVAWLVLVLVPVLVAQPIAAWVPFVLAAPLVPLLFGAFALPRTPSAPIGSAGLWWLTVFPASLAAAMLRGRDWVSGDSLSLPTVVLGAASLLLFGGLALGATTRIRHIDRAKVETLSAVSGDPRAHRRARMRWLLYGLTGAGAFALAVVAPYGPPADWARDWREAAPSAAVLTAVVGGGLAVVALAAFVGPATRRKRANVPARRRLVRVVLALTVAATGAAVWLAMRAG